MCPESAHRGVQAPAQAFCGVLCPSQSCTRLFLQCIMCQLRSKHVSFFTVQKLDDSQLATFRKGLGKLLFHPSALPLNPCFGLPPCLSLLSAFVSILVSPFWRIPL